jgi:MFS family permease
MAAVLYEPAFVVIATWFPDDAERRRALLALTVIAGFASVIYVPLAGWLVETRGWRDALIMLAALLILLTVLPTPPCRAGDPTPSTGSPTARPPWRPRSINLPGFRYGEHWPTRPCGGWSRRWSPPPWPPAR